MRGILTAGLYEPPGGRVSADEDGFTLAAHAIERLAPSPDDRAVGRRVWVVGDLPPTAAEDLARFLGPIDGELPRVVTSPSLDAAMREALSAPERSIDLVLAVALPSRGGDRPGSAGAVSSDVALALGIGPRPDRPADPPAEEPGPGLTIDRLVAEARRHGEAWAGGHGPGPAAGSGAISADEPLPADRPVAQGAYVPWPRYVESIPAHWRLAADRCAACGSVTFPPRGRCRACGRSDRLEKVRLDPASARVVASTTIGPGGQPTEFDEQVARSGPYDVVVVEFPAGVRATLQVAGPHRSRPPVGTAVSTELRRLYPMEGRWRYGRKAVLPP